MTQTSDSRESYYQKGIGGSNIITNWYKNRVTFLLWNKAFWLDGTSHVMSFNQSECVI